MIKIEIKSIFGDLLFTHEKPDNTIKETVLEAVKQKANLTRANLYAGKNADLVQVEFSTLVRFQNDLHRL